MRKVCVVLLGAGLLAISSVPAYPASTPPKELWGKTVILTISETREQRPQGTLEWRFVSGTSKHTVYFSDKGRTFLQSNVTTAAGTAVSDRSVDGKGSSAKAAGGSWRGRTYTGVVAMTRIARHVVITFDAAFNSCEAQVTFGKESGGIGLEYSPIIKQNNEVRGARITGASCSVQSGNAFAGR